MKRLLLIILLTLPSYPARGEWTALESPYQPPGILTIYVDPTTIHPDGGFMTVWELRDYRSAQGGITGRRFLSATTQKQFDCPAQRYRLLAYADFTGPMGSGDRRNGAVDPKVWRPIEPNSSNYAIWAMICKTP